MVGDILGCTKKSAIFVPKIMAKNCDKTTGQEGRTSAPRSHWVYTCDKSAHPEGRIGAPMTVLNLETGKQ